jgi:hypothetical protein
MKAWLLSSSAWTEIQFVNLNLREKEGKKIPLYCNKTIGSLWVVSLQYKKQLTVSSDLRVVWRTGEIQLTFNLDLT